MTLQFGVNNFDSNDLIQAEDSTLRAMNIGDFFDVGMVANMGNQSKEKWLEVVNIWLPGATR